MVRMRFQIGGIAGMALQAHLVRVVEEFQVALIVDIGGVKVVAMAAIGAALLHALGAQEGLHGEGDHPKAPVFVKGPQGELIVGAALIVVIKCVRVMTIIEFPFRAEAQESPTASGTERRWRYSRGC